MKTYKTVTANLSYALESSSVLLVLVYRAPLPDLSQSVLICSTLNTRDAVAPLACSYFTDHEAEVIR